MWNKIMGKSNGRGEDTISQSTQRKDSDRKSSRRRSETSNPSRKPSRGDDRDDRDNAINPAPKSYSSTTRSQFPGTAAESVASTYATAATKKIDEEYLPSGLARNASLVDQLPKTRSERGEGDDDDGRKRKSGRRRARSLSGDGKVPPRAHSTSLERKTSSKKDKRIIKENSQTEKRGIGKSDGGENFKSSRSFGNQVGSAGFMQFPGQYDGPTSGFIGGPTVSTPRISDHIQDQFPGQFPVQSTAPYRPPLAAKQGGPGLAAEYYGDAGQSVAEQPGVRLHPAGVSIGAGSHLQAASSTTAPPPEPSASGAVGAAASFFTGSFNADVEEQASYSHVSNGTTNAPVYQQVSGIPSSIPQNSSSIRPDSIHHSSSVPVMPPLGAATAGAAAGIFLSNQSSSHQQHPQYTSSAGGNAQGEISYSTNPFPQSQPQIFDSISSSAQSVKPNKHSSSQSSHLPAYAAGMAGVAGLAAAAYQQNHHSVPISSSGQQYQPTAMSQRHRHHGPLSKLVDFFKDPDGVAQFEEYTEFIGVCKYCFAPGSSPKDAPRKHHYRHRRSNERLGSSTRVDKDHRYWSSDGESRHMNKKSWLATGIAGYSLAKVGESLFNQDHGFGESNNVHSGRNSSRHEHLERRNSHSRDRKGHFSHGVTTRSSIAGTNRRSHSKDRVETGITSDGKLYRKDSHGGKSGGPSMKIYDSRRRSKSRSRSRSRSRSKHRKSKLTESAIGAAIGSSVLVSGTRRRSRSPQNTYVRSRRRSGEQSPDPTSGRGKGKHDDNYRDDRFRRSPSPSRIDVSRSSHQKGSERRHKSHKKGKKSKGFFSFSNGSSSSSSDGNLAFGVGSDKQRGIQSKGRERERHNADAALMGLGAAAAALALNETRHRGETRRKGELVAVKEFKNNHVHNPQLSSKIKKMLSSDEDMWVSASEDEYASVDSHLAYGRSSKASSRESLSDSSGTRKWGWRWGSKKREDLPKKPSTNNGTSLPVQVGAAFVGLPGSAVRASFSPDGRQPTTRSNSNNAPLQHVYPVSTSDPSRFEAAIQSSTMPSSQPSIVSRPAPIPIQHPQPVAPVPAAVYTSQPPYSHAYSAPVGDPVFSQGRHQTQLATTIDRPRNYITVPEDKIPGSFPQSDKPPYASGYTAKDIELGIRDVSSTTRASELASNSILSRRPDEASAVRFDLTEQQAEKDRQERRQRKQEDDDRHEKRGQEQKDKARQDKLQQDREDKDRRERRRQKQEDDDRREKLRQEQEDKARQDKLQRDREDDDRRDRLRQKQEDDDRREKLRQEQEDKALQDKIQQDREDDDRRDRLRQKQEDDDRREKRRHELEDRARQDRLRQEQDNRSEKSRQEQEEKAHREKIRQDLEDRARQGRLRQEQQDEDRRRKLQHDLEEKNRREKIQQEQEQLDQLKRREQQVKDERGQLPRGGTTFDNSPSKTGNYKHEDVWNGEMKGEKSLPQIVEVEPRKASSWPTQVASGIMIATTIAAAKAEKTQPDNQRDERYEKNRSLREYHSDSDISEKTQPFQEDVPKQLEDADRSSQSMKEEPISVWQAVAKVQRSSSHEDYATYFAPSEILSKSDDRTQITNANADNDISYEDPEIITIEPRGFHGSSHSPAYSFTPTGDEADAHIIDLPWVPRLNLIAPTPSPSRAGSLNDRLSPINQPIEVNEGHNEEPPKSITDPKVSWGEPETIEYTVVTPMDQRDQFIDSPSSDNGGVKEKPRIPNDIDLGKHELPWSLEGTEPGKNDAAYDDDLEFAAVLAAGLEDTGFDPSVVIDDPSFRRRDSPPRFDNVGIKKSSPKIEVGTKNSPPGGLVSLPQTGFVEGEISPIHMPGAFEEDEVEDMISTKKKNRRDKASKRKGLVDKLPEKHNDRSIIESPEIPRETSQRPESSRVKPDDSVRDVDEKLKSLKDTKLDKFSSAHIASRAEESAQLSENDILDDEFFDTTVSFKKSSDSKARSSERSRSMLTGSALDQNSNDFMDDIKSAVSDPLRESDRRSESPKTTQSSHHADLYESPSEDALSIAATGPAFNDVDEGKKSRKNSKRKSSGFSDAASLVSSSNAYTSTKSKKEKKEKRGPFGLFSRSTENTSESPQAKETFTEATAEDFEEPKKRSKKSENRSKKSENRKSSRQGSRHGSRQGDGLSGQAESSLPLENIDEDYESRMHKSKGRKDKRRSTGEGAANDSGRITQDLPAKGEEGSLGEEVRGVETGDDLPTSVDKENPLHDSLPMSFLGMRQEIPPLPDIPNLDSSKLQEDTSAEDIIPNLQNLPRQNSDSSIAKALDTPKPQESRSISDLQDLSHQDLSHQDYDTPNYVTLESTEAKENKSVGDINSDLQNLSHEDALEFPKLQGDKSMGDAISNIDRNFPTSDAMNFQKQQGDELQGITVSSLQNLSHQESDTPISDALEYQPLQGNKSMGESTSDNQSSQDHDNDAPTSGLLDDVLTTSIDSRPSSPSLKLNNQERRLSEIQSKDELASYALTSSPTAVPFHFRRPPSSPGSIRSHSSFPLSSADAVPSFVPSRQKPRPRSTEFKSSNEIRPLWLVERHSSRQEPSREEIYPSLPSSHSNSRTSSIQDMKEHGHEQGFTHQIGLDLVDTNYKPDTGPGLLIETNQDDAQSDLLDSQQQTPTAPSPQPVMKEERALEADVNQELDPMPTGAPSVHDLSFTDIALPQEFQVGKGLTSEEEKIGLEAKANQELDPVPTGASNVHDQSFANVSSSREAQMRGDLSGEVTNHGASIESYSPSIHPSPSMEISPLLQPQNDHELALDDKMHKDSEYNEPLSPSKSASPSTNNPSSQQLQIIEDVPLENKIQQEPRSFEPVVSFANDETSPKTPPLEQLQAQREVTPKQDFFQESESLANMSLSPRSSVDSKVVEEPISVAKASFSPKNSSLKPNIAQEPEFIENVSIFPKPSSPEHDIATKPESTENVLLSPTTSSTKRDIAHEPEFVKNVPLSSTSSSMRRDIAQEPEFIENVPFSPTFSSPKEDAAQEPESIENVPFSPTISSSKEDVAQEPECIENVSFSPTISSPNEGVAQEPEFTENFSFFPKTSSREQNIAQEPADASFFPKAPIVNQVQEKAPLDHETLQELQSGVDVTFSEYDITQEPKFAANASLISKPPSLKRTEIQDKATLEHDTIQEPESIAYVPATPPSRLSPINENIALEEKHSVPQAGLVSPHTPLSRRSLTNEDAALENEQSVPQTASLSPNPPLSRQSPIDENAVLETEQSAPRVVSFSPKSPLSRQSPINGKAFLENEQSAPPKTPSPTGCEAVSHSPETLPHKCPTNEDVFLENEQLSFQAAPLSSMTPSSSAAQAVSLFPKTLPLEFPPSENVALENERSSPQTAPLSPETQPGQFLVNEDAVWEDKQPASQAPSLSPRTPSPSTPREFSVSREIPTPPAVQSISLSPNTLPHQTVKNEGATSENEQLLTVAISPKTSPPAALKESSISPRNPTRPAIQQASFSPNTLPHQSLKNEGVASENERPPAFAISSETPPLSTPKAVSISPKTSTLQAIQSVSLSPNTLPRQSFENEHVASEDELPLAAAITPETLPPSAPKIVSISPETPTPSAIQTVSFSPKTLPHQPLTNEDVALEDEQQVPRAASISPKTPPQSAPEVVSHSRKTLLHESPTNEGMTLKDKQSTLQAIQLETTQAPRSKPRSPSPQLQSDALPDTSYPTVGTGIVTGSKSESMKTHAVEATIGAGLLGSGIMQQRGSKKDKKKDKNKDKKAAKKAAKKTAKKGSKSSKWTDFEDPEESTSVDPAQLDNLDAGDQLSTSGPPTSVDAWQQSQDTPPSTNMNIDTPKSDDRTSAFILEKSSNRDSAIHVSDSPLIPEPLPIHHTIRDSGYQDAELSPRLDPNKGFAEKADEQPNEDVMDRLARDVKPARNIDDQNGQSLHNSKSSSEIPLNISVEVDSDYEVSILGSGLERERSKSSPKVTRDEPEEGLSGSKKSSESFREPSPADSVKVTSDERQRNLLDSKQSSDSLQIAGFISESPCEPSPADSIKRTNDKQNKSLFDSKQSSDNLPTASLISESPPEPSPADSIERTNDEQEKSLFDSKQSSDNLQTAGLTFENPRGQSPTKAFKLTDDLFNRNKGSETFQTVGSVFEKPREQSPVNSSKVLGDNEEVGFPDRNQGSKSVQTASPIFDSPREPPSVNSSKVTGAEQQEGVFGRNQSFENLQTAGPIPEDPRQPSPVSSTTKDRSSTLFLSSPSTKEDIAHRSSEQDGPLDGRMDWEGDDKDDMEDWSQSVDFPKNNDQIPAAELPRIPAVSNKPAAELPWIPEIPNEPSDKERPSIFGGPMGIAENIRTPSRSPFASDHSNRQRLNTISEYSPEESPLHKKNRSLSDVGSPERGVKSRRRTATPQGVSQLRTKSPLGAEATIKNPISIDDLATRLSWPAVDEDNDTVDLERSRSGNANDPTTGRQDTWSALTSSRLRQHESERRSLSGTSAVSVGSVESINAIIRTPDQTIRSASGLSQRGSGTPPLRRSDRSVSGDLRVAHKQSEAKNLAKAYAAEPDVAIPSSSTYDPTKDKGKTRARDMADIYEGWGDVHQASPRSPTRPPSMRRRQSLQVLDLETKVDQLVSEKRLLQDAKSRAEKTLEVAEQDRIQQHSTFTEAIQSRDLFLKQKDSELTELRQLIETLQGQVSRLTKVNEELTTARADLNEEHEQRYNQLEADHSHAHQQWQQSTRELDEIREQHTQLSTGMEQIVRHEVSVAVEERNRELQKLHDELEATKEQVRVLQQQILASKSLDDPVIERDEDYFDVKCQELCGHVQQWVLRFSKFSDSKACYLAREVSDPKITDRFENAILDGSDVDLYLADRVKRRDVFMSVVMTMVWEYIFTRYLFGMDREQRQKLKQLEKTLSDVGPAAAVTRWRATTLTLLAKRASFPAQRAEDTEAVVQEIYQTLATFLPPPTHLVTPIQDSLRNVMGAAVDLSIEMRTQRAEYVMLPPLQPEYDTNGNLARKVYFIAATMNERSGLTSSNEALEAQHAVLRMVLFPLVVKRGGDAGMENDEIVICPAQVLTAKEPKNKKVVRVVSAQGGRSTVGSFGGSVEGGASAVDLGGSDVGMGNMI